MARPGPLTGAEDAPPSAGETRLEALLDERLAPAQRSAFARELAAHDRARPADAAGGPDAALLRRGLRFRGPVPERVRRLLAEWVPELMRYADARGLRLRDPYQALHVYMRPAFEAEHGALPPDVRLPASSFQYHPALRRYTVRVVLPERLENLDALFTVLRALLTRLYGDVFLREEILPLPAYREDVEQAAAVSVGLAEQVAVLAALPHASAALEAALDARARALRMHPRRQAEPVRAAWFAEAARELAAQRLAPERQALIEHEFAGYVEALRADVSGGVTALLEAIAAQDRPLRFLPPDEAPHYARLCAQQPLACLRAVKLRLEFLLEALAGVAEDFEALAAPGGAYPTLAEARVAGWLDALERGGLARPYLVPGARLSEELERKRAAFPLEVHGLLTRFPPGQRSEREFHRLRKALEGSLHQRLYNALVLMRHAMRRHDAGQGDAFARADSFQTLKGLVANFRLRRPLLEALFLRIGVVLEVAGRAPPTTQTEAARARFPVDVFARAWGQFAAHALLADYVAQRHPVQGFDRARYWARVEARLRARMDSAEAGARLQHLLRRIQLAAGEDDGLPLLAEMLRQSTPTFRFSVIQALRPRPPGKDAAAWLAQFDAWAQSVLQARERSLRNAIVVGDAAS